MNQVWCWDFIVDRTVNGQSLKWLSIVDEYTRRCITLDVSRNMTSEDVINRLAELFTIYGVPEHIRSHNGPEFIAQAIQLWLQGPNCQQPITKTPIFITNFLAEDQIGFLLTRSSRFRKLGCVIEVLSWLKSVQMVFGSNCQAA